VEHSSFFTTKEDALDFTQAVTQNGFFHMQTQKSSFDEFEIEVKFFKKTIPDYATIDKETLELFEIAQAHNGTYGGWECSIVTQ